MQETQLKDLSKTWLLCLILITTLLAAGPGIYQALNEDGLVFYLNGQDEGSYLQYDFAKTSLIATHRFVEFIVIELHEFGLSGGWINLVFDVFIPPAIILLIFYSFYSTKDLTPITSTIAFLGLTSIISATNPLVENYFIESVRSGSLYWVTMPATYLNPILRSPDPQWSYLLIAASSFFAIRTRSLVPLWIIAPFLYSFISIALIYILIGNFISRFLKTKVIYICFLAFSTISLFLLIYFKFFLTDLARLDLVNSRLPLISFTGIFSVAAFLLCKQRTLNLALAASLPWALANQQIISG